MSQFDNVRFVGRGEMQLIPPSPELCQMCACDHAPNFPHNLQSLYYHVWFKQQHGRAPTWDDAFEGCSDETVKLFVDFYQEAGVTIEHSRNLDG